MPGMPAWLLWGPCSEVGPISGTGSPRSVSQVCITSISGPWEIAIRSAKTLNCSSSARSGASAAISRA